MRRSRAPNKQHRYNATTATLTISATTKVIQLVLVILVAVRTVLVAYVIRRDDIDPRLSREKLRKRGKWHIRGVSIMSTISERSVEGARTPRRRTNVSDDYAAGC